MQFNEYSNEAITTAVFPEDLSVIYPALGLAGETGEVCEKVKKVIRDNNGYFDKEKSQAILLELGDVLWYLNALAYGLGYTLKDVAEANLTKLRSRRSRNVLHGNGDNR